MTAAVQQLLEHFDRLATDDQQQVAQEILRRTADYDLSPLSDEALLQQADELFLALDRAEAADAQES